MHTRQPEDSDEAAKLAELREVAVHQVSIYQLAHIRPRSDDKCERRESQAKLQPLQSEATLASVQVAELGACIGGVRQELPPSDSISP